MKNPFVQMTLVAAAMAMAFRENILRDSGVPIGAPKYRGRGPKNPPGTKMLRQFYRNKHGVRGTAEEARKWYSSLK